MSWNYAELSKTAKDAGGPEKLMNLLVESGKQAGHKDMLPVVGLALGLGALGYAGVQKAVQYFKKKKVSPAAVEGAKRELIQGINEYDATHPDADDVAEETENTEQEEENDE